MKYISKRNRMRIFHFLYEWKSIILEEGLHAKNDFLLRNGELNPKFIKFYKSKQHIKKCILSKAREEDKDYSVIIEVVGSENYPQAMFFQDLADFDPDYMNKGIKFRYVENPVEVVDTIFKYGDPYSNCFGIHVSGLFPDNSGISHNSKGCETIGPVVYLQS